MTDVCGITSLFHVLVKTNDLQQTLIFYKEVLGLREAPRPPLGTPGAWLACPSPIGEQIIHIWAGGAGMGKSGVSPYGTGTIDHVSFMAIGHEAYRKRFIARLLLARVMHELRGPRPEFLQSMQIGISFQRFVAWSMRK